MIYKVSYVVLGSGEHTGTIVNQETSPEIGDRVELNGQTYEVVEVLELMPPRGEFGYYHATCQPMQE